MVGHVMFGTCLRVLGLEKSHGVVNNSACYRVSATFFYRSNFDASVEPVELCPEKRGALPSTRWWCVLCGEHHYSKSWTVSRIKAKYQLGKKGIQKRTERSRRLPRIFSVWLLLRETRRCRRPRQYQCTVACRLPRLMAIGIAVTSTTAATLTLAGSSAWSMWL